ncbi:hypothetical protein ALON55S_02177 [Alishewanella longhuensis]
MPSMSVRYLIVLLLAVTPLLLNNVTEAIMFNFRIFAVLLISVACIPATAFASSGPLDLTLSPIGLIALGLFTLAYMLVMAEEKIHLRKSKPVLVAAGIIWALIGWRYMQAGMPDAAESAFRHTLLEFSELMLFLLVAMTYINALEERRLFDALRAWLIAQVLVIAACSGLAGFSPFLSLRLLII